MKRTAAILALAFVATNAAALEQNAELQACREDMQKFCTDVQPGEGRQMKCMYEQRDRLSPGCAALVTQKYERFEQLRRAKEKRY